MQNWFAWMAWTWQTAVFFAVIAALLVLMTILAIVRPESPRAGILRISTTRGDRLFVSLLGAAFIYVLWFRLGTAALWPPAVIAVIWAAVMFAFA
jgi:predicted small integral membrane protein